MKLRILIADDHEVVRRGLAALLQTHEGWEVCGEAKGRTPSRRDGQAVKTGRGDFGYRHADPQRFGCHTPNGTAEPSLQKMIVLTITDSDQVIREALDAGARGFVLKSDAARDLVSAVEAVQNMTACSSLRA
jgi:DNA-binding NarL/FixJ family response regulator